MVLLSKDTPLESCTLSNHNIQFPEVLSRNEEQNDRSRTLSEKLTEALLNIRSKEELIKQHEKFAEEAVAGWERAEEELLILVKRTDALAHKNTVLEESVSHLDGALKECLRQLRQERDYQEDKINYGIAEKSRELEQMETELENQLAELHSRLHNVNIDAINYKITDLSSKLEASEKENSLLKLSLLSKNEELQLKTRERNMSIEAAESASKHHLDIIKKVAKLEAECRRLNSVARKSTLVNDDCAVTALFDYVKCFVDSPADGPEELWDIEMRSPRIDELESIDVESCHLDRQASGFKVGQVTCDSTLGRSLIMSSFEIELMDDFLEMERIVVSHPETQILSNGTMDETKEDPFQDKPTAQYTRTDELKRSIEKLNLEKIKLEMALSKSQIQLKKSEDQLNQSDERLVYLSAQLAIANEEKIAAQEEAAFINEKFKNSSKFLDEAKVNLSCIRSKLSDSNEEKSILMVELENARIRNQEAETRVQIMELELKSLRSINFSLSEEINREKSYSREIVSKAKKLEMETSKMKVESMFQRTTIVEEMRINKDKELARASTKFSECRRTIACLDHQLKYLSSLDNILFDSERPVEI